VRRRQPPSPEPGDRSTGDPRGLVVGVVQDLDLEPVAGPGQPARGGDDALGDVPLTAAQRTQIEKLAADAEARHADARAAHKDLMLAVAAQVESGAIDRQALKPKLDALTAAMVKVQPADRASFEQLHALLSADQRTAFVDALTARIGEHKEKLHGAHPLKQWAEDLKLTDAQRTQIRDALHDRFRGMGHAQGGEMPWTVEHHDAKVLTAFKQDRFVMDEVAPPKDLSDVASKLSEHVLGLAETVLPLLTPEQRTLAASKIREKVNAGASLGQVF